MSAITPRRPTLETAEQSPAPATRLFATLLMLLGIGAAAAALLGPLVTGIIEYHISEGARDQVIGGDVAVLALAGEDTHGVVAFDDGGRRMRWTMDLRRWRADRDPAVVFDAGIERPAVLERAPLRKPDVVVLNDILRDMNGSTVASILRAIASPPLCVAIKMTSSVHSDMMSVPSPAISRACAGSSSASVGSAQQVAVAGAGQLGAGGSAAYQGASAATCRRSAHEKLKLLIHVVDKLHKCLIFCNKFSC